MKKKILCITRVSTDRQDLTQQHEEMENWLTSTLHYKKDEIEWLEAKGASAQSINKKYIDFIDTMFKKFDEIPTLTACCAWHLNRFGRNEDYLGKIKTFFVSREIQCYIKTLNLKLLVPQTQPDGSIKNVVDFGAGIAWSVFASIVYYEALELKQKSMRAKKIMKNEGKFTGHNLTIGYKVNPNTKEYEIDEEEAEFVRLTFKMCIEGFGQRKIYKELKERGYKKSIGIVMHSVHNRQYLGEPHPDSGIKLPAIIDKETFEKAQTALKQRQTNMNMKDEQRKLLCRGLIKCAECGSVYSIQGSLYQCSGIKARGGSCNNTNGISQESLDRFILNEIVSQRYYWLCQKQDNDYKKEALEELKLNETKLSTYKNKLPSIDDKKIRIGDLYADGVYSKEKYNTKLNDIKNEEKDILDNINKFEQKILQIKSSLSLYEDENEMLRYITDAENAKLDLDTDFEKCYKAVHLIVEEIKVSYGSDRYSKIIEVKTKNGEELKYEYYPKKRILSEKFKYVEE